MTDRQLSGFVAVVDKGSFTAAADSLYISQSALSQQIIQLERQLGFSLFDRRNRQAVLTDAGKAFYEKACRILDLYRSGTEEGKYLEKLAEERKKRLLVACEGDQFLQIWMDFFFIARDVGGRYTPLAVRYDSREQLYTALRQGDVDIAVQLENPDIRRYGLCCLPFARVMERCYFPPGMNELPFPREEHLTPEDLAPYAVAFHNKPGVCDYEDALRSHLADRLPNIRLLNPADFFFANYAPTVLLVPAIQHTSNLTQYVRQLDWGEGAKVCFVISPQCEERAMEYALYIKEHITARVCPWYLPLEAGIQPLPAPGQ